MSQAQRESGEPVGRRRICAEAMWPLLADMKNP